jgi:hypothetical protein
MPTRTRPPARRGSSRRAPPSPKRKRRLDPKAAAERASRLPHHPRYTAALLAQVRRRFEETPEPILSMAADLGVAPESLHRIARRHGWVRRKPAPPPRDLPPAMRLLEEAKALEVGANGAGATSGADGSSEAVLRVTLPPRSGGEGRPPKAVGVGGLACRECEAPPTPDPSPPLASLVGGGESKRPA